MQVRQSRLQFIAGMTVALLLAVASPASAELNPALQAKLVADISPGAATSDPLLFNGSINDGIAFGATTPEFGTEPWFTDGTPEGTFQLADINPGPASSGSSFGPIFSPYHSLLYFSATAPGLGSELWRTDGTSAGTKLVTDIATGSGSSNPSSFAVLNDTLFFFASTPGTGTEIFKLDADGSAVLAAETIAGGTSAVDVSNGLFVVGSRLFFTASANDHGTEPWTSFGTTASTSELKDVFPGPGNSGASAPNITVEDGIAYFSGRSAAEGFELWRSDGSSSGTNIVADVNPGNPGGYNSSIQRIGGAFFFAGTNASSGRELWTTNGISGATLVKDVQPGNGDGGGSPIGGVGGAVLFGGNDGVNSTEIWRSDGTPGGTSMVINLNPSGAGYLGSSEMLGETVLFSGNDGSSGSEVFASDGTAAGTKLIADLNPGPGASSPGFPGANGDDQYFTATTPELGKELYVVGLPQLSAGSGALGDSPLGNPSSSPLTVSASSPFATKLGEVTLEGADASDFRVSPGSCAPGADLDARTTCDLDVTFLPRSPGPAAATLQLTHSDAQNPLQVALNGTATADMAKPKITAKARVKGGKVTIEAQCDEICSLSASGKVKGGGKLPKAKPREVDPLDGATLTLKAKGRTKRALAGRGKVKVQLKLKAIDLSKNSAKRKLKLKG